MSTKRPNNLAVPDHVSSRRFDDELVLLDLSGGNYFALNTVGADMWKALASGSTPEEVAGLIADRYDVERNVALADCLRLVDELVNRRLLQRVAP